MPQRKSDNNLVFILFVFGHCLCTNHLKTVLCSVKEIFVIVFFLPFFLNLALLLHPVRQHQQSIISVLD